MIKEDFPEEMGLQLDLKIQKVVRHMERQAQGIPGKQRGKAGRCR